MQKQGRQPAGSLALRWKWWGRQVAQLGPSTLAWGEWGGTGWVTWPCHLLPGLGDMLGGGGRLTLQWHCPSASQPSLMLPRGSHWHCALGTPGSAVEWGGTAIRHGAPLSATARDTTSSSPHNAHLGTALPAAGPPHTQASTYGGVQKKPMKGVLHPKKQPLTPGFPGTSRRDARCVQGRMRCRWAVRPCPRSSSWSPCRGDKGMGETLPLSPGM